MRGYAWRVPDNFEGKVTVTVEVEPIPFEFEIKPLVIEIEKSTKKK